MVGLNIFLHYCRPKESPYEKGLGCHVMTLFGGIIGWAANKQGTVTTSTTEAELLALAQAAKEGIYIYRLLNEMNIIKGKTGVQIECDNQQTLRLINDEITKLRTKLRHVDIHNHWLRQEVQEGRITAKYVPSNKMIANGLMKVLSEKEFRDFVRQVGLEDLSQSLRE